MENEKKNNEDLNSLIDDYGSDNELRRKIAEMKKQKEQQTIGSQATVVEPTIEPAEKEEIVDATKTLVMPNAQAATEEASATKTIVRPVLKEEEATQTLETLDDEEEFVLDESDEEDEVEDEDEEVINEEENDEQGADEGKNAKMNKALTYGIIGLVAILVVIAAVFGLKALTSSDKKDKDKVEEQQLLEDEKEDAMEKEDQEESANDTDGRIASLKQQNDAWKKEIGRIENELIDLKAEKKSAESSLSRLESTAKKAQDAATAYDKGEYSQALAEFEDAEDRHKNGEMSDDEYNAIRSRYQTAEIEYNRLSQEAGRATDEYQEVKDSIRSWKDKIDAKESEKGRIEADIRANEAELARLER